MVVYTLFSPKFVAAELVISMTSALQKSECCSATSAAQLSENCSAASVFRKEPEGKNAKGKSLSKLFGEAKMFAEEISEEFSQDRRYHFHCFLEYFWISSKSSQKIALFWEVFGSFLPLSLFQVFACDMLQGWGLEGWGLGLAENKIVKGAEFAAKSLKLCGGGGGSSFVGCLDPRRGDIRKGCDCNTCHGDLDAQLAAISNPTRERFEIATIWNRCDFSCNFCVEFSEFQQI